MVMNKRTAVSIIKISRMVLILIYNAKIAMNAIDNIRCIHSAFYIQGVGCQKQSLRFVVNIT